MEEYDIHPSAELRRVYKGYQEQDPALARFLFLGKDANFAKDIEGMDIFEEVKAYLTDGVGYRKDKKRHHPFLSPDYPRRDGRTYHENFRKLELGLGHADKVSFIELPHCRFIPLLFCRSVVLSHRRAVELCSCCAAALLLC